MKRRVVGQRIQAIAHVDGLRLRADKPTNWPRVVMVTCAFVVRVLSDVCGRSLLKHTTMVRFATRRACSIKRSPYPCSTGVSSSLPNNAAMGPSFVAHRRAMPPSAPTSPPESPPPAAPAEGALLPPP